MKPIGPLMREHRIIERMASLLNKEISSIKENGKANTEFILLAVDFFRMYADRTHHGKEEDILFRDLSRKQLSTEHRKVMDELMQEHMQARKMVRSLLEAREAYSRGEAKSLDNIITLLNNLTAFYPVHIQKEDKHFFYPVQDYFSRKEQDAMLAEFWDFDRKLIHEKYQKLVLRLEGQPETKFEPWP